MGAPAGALPPAPSAIIGVAGEDGAVIRVRRHGNPRGNRLIVSHGNGFATDGYAGFWSRFLADFEIVLFDARNHGWNALADPPGHDYAHMARDLDRVRDAAAAEFGEKPTAGLFHSMSAQAAMLAALEIGWRFDALVLFDPPNNPAAGHPARAPMVGYLIMLVAWARARRERFADPAELARDYAATRAGRSWAAGSHLAVAQSVLRHWDDGWVLRCPPELEAAMYEQGINLDLWPPASAFAGPVKLIGADPARERPDPTALSNQALARDGSYDYLALPGAGHLLQLEQPVACAGAVREFLASAGIR
ncbi:MAG TPA: alpha/beta hydrolase [Stellaceae bacterium]|nr:alpha/beta hydrolase [Stellaceae bacterium]